MSKNSFETLREDYAERWASMQIRGDWAARARKQAQRVLDARRHYEPVSGATGVPWHVIGIIHLMECGGSFKGHLHNGDPLTARTRQVPKGRPLVGSPPFKWDESAIDALRYDGLDKVDEWTPERLAWCLEKFNGFGSRNKGVPSAYLWSGTDQYSRGKYVADHVWDPNHVSQQVGGMAILKALMELDPSITFDDDLAPAANEFPKAEKDDEEDDGPVDPPSVPDAGKDRPESESKGSVLDWLAEQGSRIAKVIETARRIFVGLTVGTGAAAGAVTVAKQAGVKNGTVDAAGSVASDYHLVLLYVVIGLLVLSLGGLIYVCRHFVFTAAKDGRYSPRGTAKKVA